MVLDRGKLRRTILRAVGLLVTGQYRVLGAVSKDRGMSEADMAEAVRSYPYRLAMPPDERLEALVDVDEDVIPIPEATPPGMAVDVRLWDVDEGTPRSDLRLCMWLTEGPGELYDIEVRSIHAM